MRHFGFSNLIEMILELVGGLGIFLLGMKNMSDGMQAVAGTSLRRLAMFLMGIGMVFFGLEVMKDACSTIKDIPDFEAWFAKFNADTYFGVLKCAAVGCYNPDFAAEQQDNISESSNVPLSAASSQR